MGDLNLSQYQAAVLAMLPLTGSIGATHPIITNGFHTRAINHAPGRMILSQPDRFPEHQGRSWTAGPTIVGDNRIALPANMLVLHKVNSNELETDPAVSPGDWTFVQEQRVPDTDVDSIGLYAKDADTDGYPALCARKASDLYYWPTTRSGFTCYFREYGISTETFLSAAGDTFRMNRQYDNIIVLLAASETAAAMTWTERSIELLGQAELEFGAPLRDMKSVVAMERARKRIVLRPAGLPRC